MSNAIEAYLATDCEGMQRIESPLNEGDVAWLIIKAPDLESGTVIEFDLDKIYGKVTFTNPMTATTIVIGP